MEGGADLFSGPRPDGPANTATCPDGAIQLFAGQHAGFRFGGLRDIGARHWRASGARR